MRLTLMGTAHGYQTYCRFVSSSLLEVNGRMYLIDAGPPADGLIIRQGKDVKRLNGVFITHMHEDHAGSLPDVYKRQALAGTERDPGMDKQALSRLSEYWSQVRPLYAQFEAGLNSPDTQIYQLEIPGGQYSNFKPQVESLGLGHRFEEVKAMYSTVNQMLGDIIKVTPSSKMVGDLAIFMVQNNLTPDNIVERAATLHFPDSVISYFKGMMGQPKGGFPVDLQKAVLKGEEPITCRPGQLLPPVDLEAVRASLPETHRDDASVLSACLYPKVFEEYLDFLSEYSDLSSMDTHVFLRGMDPGAVSYTHLDVYKRQT